MGTTADLDITKSVIKPSMAKHTVEARLFGICPRPGFAGSLIEVKGAALRVSGAIEHGRHLAKRLRDDRRRTDPALSIVVIDESGTEIHRERVYPDAPESGISAGGIA